MRRYVVREVAVSGGYVWVFVRGRMRRVWVRSGADRRAAYLYQWSIRQDVCRLRQAERARDEVCSGMLWFLGGLAVVQLLGWLLG
jgi:hypothetical protein